MSGRAEERKRSSDQNSAVLASSDLGSAWQREVLEGRLSGLIRCSVRSGDSPGEKGGW